ncbi:MAG: pyridoxal phosphate-dependent aminotransferase [Candidatus Kapabacteria bacterium]|nr:pyridoxal phosphate-dependent aminotransferase [Ignavibacteriota bacterium]MCW5885803.1 pyridoxal phosphate-dependent aminotransferase [Candidatus Kapabacteria bacterium]
MLHADIHADEYTNPNVLGLTESDTLVINARSKQLMSEGKQVFRFGLGQSPFPVPDSIVDCLRLNAPQKDYLPVQGLQALREAVAYFHRRKDGIDINPNCVIIGPGSKELVFLLQLVFNSEVIIVSPCWVSYVPQAKILGKEISVIHSRYQDKWHLTPKLFEEFLTKRNVGNKPSLMILNYPGNPDGGSIEERDLKAIADLAREHHIFILSDEIYGQLHHQGKHISIGRFYPEGTIISSGLSKWCGAGGWRLGTFAFPENLSWILDKMAIVASETYTSVSAPIQYAAVQAFRGGSEIEEYLWQARKILSNLGKECVQILKRGGVKVYEPTGGFYLFLDFSKFAKKLNAKGITTSKQLCSQLLNDTGVAILHGSSFSRPENEFSARMAYVDFDGAGALATARTTPLHKSLPDDFNEVNCKNVIEGVNEIVKWFKGL